MSAIPAGHHRLTYEDYAVLPDDGRRYELLDGRVHVSPAPRPRHQTVSRRIQFALYNLERAGLGQVFNAPIDVILSPHDIVQPHEVRLHAADAELVTDRAIEGIPPLLVEILSPSTRRYDVIVKAERYAAVGVPRYWIVDPELDRIDAMRLEGEAYVEEARVAAPLVWSLPWLHDLALDLGVVFRRT